MDDGRVVPKWLKSLPLAPEYRPTDTEFADPIAFISRIEQEASAFGICKVIPPLPKPNKRFVFANLTRSFSSSPDLSPPLASKNAAAAPVFTTRQQELGSKKPRGASVHKQVWQSGDFYTLEQFEAKSKAFAKTQLGSSLKDATPLEVETVFWKTAAEKPIYVEYANDVPGSGFAVPEDTHGYHYRRRRGKKARFRHGRRSLDGSVMNLPASENSIVTQSVPQPDNSEFKKVLEGTAGWKLSNSPWNLQVIARSPGSLTRFMPDEVPGVTSPMVYIAMLFSWFAWHVEDHELHSLNFLHTGAPKTWYAVPGDYATDVEELVHQQGYGDNIDKLAAFMILGEKRTLFSPEILVASGIPCCRLVQNPGEFVVTFPRAYHVGFSHGFNCGEAANFATSKWLEFAKEAATRRAAMNYLPMLSHQQLLYMLAMSFISRVPRTLLPGARSSRLRDRRKEERELLVKKVFLQDLTCEQKLVRLLLEKKQGSCAVLWDSDLLPPAINSQSSSQLAALTSFENPGRLDKDEMGGIVRGEGDSKLLNSLSDKKSEQVGIYGTRLYTEDCVESAYIDDGDLPCGLDADSGVLPCVACGILGYPFMCMIQPSDKASQQLFVASNERTDRMFLKAKENDSRKADVLDYASYSRRKNSGKHEIANLFDELTSASDCSLACQDTLPLLDISASQYQPVTCGDHSEDEHQLIERDDSECGTLIEKFPSNGLKNVGRSVNDLSENVEKYFSGRLLRRKAKIGDEGLTCTLRGNCSNHYENWDTSNPYLKPRLFCLRHALEVEELLSCKGGSRILVICNSDYLKIMGQAMSVDKEIGVQLNTGDIPLTNASKEELDLINFSIDDYEYIEQGEDWTMKLGVNLRHFVKGRKRSSPKREPFPSALGGLFSDTFCHHIDPSLRWKGKRSRTPYRMMTENDSKRVFKIGGHIKDYRRIIATICNREGGKSSGMRTNKWQDLVNNQSGELHERSGAVPFDNTVGIKEQEAHSCIPCSSNSEFVNDECLDMNHRDSSALESESPTAEFIFLPPDTADGCCLVETEVRIKDSVDNVDEVELRNSCSPVPETLVLAQNLPCLESNSEYRVDNSDLSNDLGIIAADTSEPQCDNGLVNEVVLATETTDSVNLLTEWSDPTFICNPKLPQPILNNSPENKGCFDEITEPCIGVVVSDRVSDSVDPNNAGLAPLNGDPVISRAEPPDPMIVDDTKSLPNMMVDNPPEDDTCSDSILEPCISVSVSDTVNYAVDLEASALKENSFKRCTVDPVKSECQMNSDLSLRGSFEPCEAMWTRSAAEPDRPFAALNSRMVRCVYVRRKNRAKKKDDPIIHSCSDKSADTLENTNFEAQETPATAVNGCKAACGPAASSEEGYGCADYEFLRVKKTKGFKRKREVDQLSTTQYSGNSFVRGPCEGLRARTGRIAYEKPKIRDLKTASGYATKKPKPVTAFKGKSNTKLLLVCGLEGCKRRFHTKEELNLHRRNRCTYEGCGKRFRNHRYTMRHQRVHDNNRPFKCPWKGCSKSFNWEWARTEHVRLHTGERPYKCSDLECGLTFRFISDFSRHRRKTGHGAGG